jgi:hypothetical protein
MRFWAVGDTNSQFAIANCCCGRLHYDCEQVLLKDGSKQKDVWGADWFPFTQEIGYESLINIRPSQNNRGMEIRNPIIRERIAEIIQNLLGGIGSL